MNKAVIASRFKAVGTTLKKHKKMLLIALVALLVLVGTFVYREYQQAAAEARLCRSNTDLLVSLQKNLSDGKFSEADGQIKQVEELTDNQSSADCLFVHAEYAATVGDIAKAEELFKKLGAINDLTITKELLSNVFEEPLDYLKKRIDFLKTAQQESKQNFVGVDEATDEVQQ